MTLTPSTLRLDLKCGNGAISEGETCTKGNATAVKPAKKNRSKGGLKSNLAKALIIGGGATALAGGVGWAASLARGIKNEFNSPRKSSKYFKLSHSMNEGYKAKRLRNISAAIGGLGLAAVGSGLVAEGVKTKNSQLRNSGAQMAIGAGLGSAAAIAGAEEAKRQQKAVIKEAKEFRRKMGANRKRVRDFKTWAEAYAEEFRRRAQQAGGAYPGSSASQAAAAYSDLGVSPDATDAEVKRAWKKKARENHPDLGGDPEQAKKYNAAYQAILRSRGIKDTEDTLPSTSIWAYGFSS